MNAKNHPKLEAIFFRTGNGKEPVREWLLDLALDERRKIGEEVAYVQFKWQLGKPQVDHLQGPIWEVRVNLSTRIVRVLFVVVGMKMLLLHGFIKKTQATPKQEIALAQKRYDEWRTYYEQK